MCAGLSAGLLTLTIHALGQAAAGRWSGASSSGGWRTVPRVGGP